MTSIQVAYLNYLENKRHNVQYEIETVRHNQASESIGQTQAWASVMQAEASQRQAEIQAQIEHLQEIRTRYQNQVDVSNMRLNEARAESQRLQNEYQRMVNANYAKYGDDQAAADLGYTISKTTESDTRSIGNVVGAIKTGADVAGKIWTFVTGQSGLPAWT